MIFTVPFTIHYTWVTRLQIYSIDGITQIAPTAFDKI